MADEPKKGTAKKKPSLEEKQRIERTKPPAPQAVTPPPVESPIPIAKPQFELGFEPVYDEGPIDDAISGSYEIATALQRTIDASVQMAIGAISGTEKQLKNKIVDHLGAQISTAARTTNDLQQSIGSVVGNSLGPINQASQAAIDFVMQALQVNEEEAQDIIALGNFQLDQLRKLYPPNRPKKPPVDNTPKLPPGAPGQHNPNNPPGDNGNAPPDELPKPPAAIGGVNNPLDNPGGGFGGNNDPVKPPGQDDEGCEQPWRIDFNWPGCEVPVNGVVPIDMNKVAEITRLVKSAVTKLHATGRVHSSSVYTALDSKLMRCYGWDVNRRLNVLPPAIDRYIWPVKFLHPQVWIGDIQITGGDLCQTYAYNPTGGNLVTEGRPPRAQPPGEEPPDEPVGPEPPKPPGPVPLPPSTVPPDDDDEEPPCKPPVYTLWESAYSGECYITKDDEGPRSAGDKRLASGEPSTGWLSTVLAECGKKPLEKTEPPADNLAKPAFRFPPAFGCNDPGAYYTDTNTDDWLWYWGKHLERNIRDSVNKQLAGESWFWEAARKTVQTTFAIPTLIAEVAASMVQDLFRAQACASSANSRIQLGRVILGFCERWIGSAFNQLQRPLDHRGNYICPTEIPSNAEAVQAYLAGIYDLDRVQCITRANGNIWEEYKHIVNASVNKLGVTDLVALWRRLKIDDKELAERVRQLGYIVPSDVEEFKELSTQIPVISDVLRFMVRDVEDDTLVEQFGMDADFNQKWKGQLKEWGYNQGIEDKYAKYAWRAHWSIPSPTQLYEMYHRLRHDPKYGGPEAFREMIKTALQQQDILPFWIDKLLDVSFRNLTRVDVKRAFEQGSLGPDDVRKAYIDGGYSDANAQILTDYTVRQRNLLFSRSPVAKQYIEGVITRDEFRKALKDLGADAEATEFVEGKVSVQRRAIRRKKCIAALRKRYLWGEIDNIAAVPLLTAQGLDNEARDEIVAAWQCERDARGKFATIKQLCEWHSGGFLTDGQYFDRLVKSGWSIEDAEIIVGNCSNNAQVKKAKAQAAQDAKQMREAQKREAEATKGQKADVAREKQAKAALDRINAIRQRRDDEKLEIAARISKILGIPIGDAKRLVTGTLSGLTTGQGGELDAALKAMLIVAQKVKFKTVDEFRTAVIEAISQA